MERTDVVVGGRGVLAGWVDGKGGGLGCVPYFREL